MTLTYFSSFLKSNLASSVCRTVFTRTKFTKPPKNSLNDREGFSKHRQNSPFEPRRIVPKHHKQNLFSSQPVVLPPRLPAIPKQKFDYFLVLDIEATCDSPTNVDPQEIIEFPVLKVNGETFRIEAKFHSYARPTVVPQLSDFCTSLTGIIQEMIDQQPDFKVVFQDFLAWLEKQEILKPGVNFAFVTCEDTDLQYFFPIQCKISGIEVPDFMKRWINIKRSFADLPPYKYPASLTTMLKFCELLPEGQLHSGLDDAVNIAGILRDLAQRGLVYDYNGSKE